MGYCHGADRGMQLVLVQTLAAGRASELLSSDEEMLEVDRFFRRLDFGRAADAELDKLPTAERALLDAYVDGVNRALSKGPAWELRLLGVKKATYTAADAMALGRLIAYVNLAQTQGEMERLLVEMVQAGVPREHLEDLFPGELGDLDPYLLRKVKLGERVVPDAVRWLVSVPRTVGSNNWVIAGRKTASGHAMLANDPHLEVNRLPAVWYEIVLRQGARYFVGATMPGLPAAIIGRNNDLAWGVTYAFMDATDSWVESCKGGAYRRMDGGEERWVPFVERREVIKRKGKPDETLVIYENDHGVLDGDPHVQGHYLATRWASTHGTGAASIAAFMGLQRATSVKQGMSLCSHIETAWNWVLADAQGAIGYQMSGRMPARKEGRSGMVPLPGWDPGNDWQGWVSQDRLPWMLDPEVGYFVTANQDLNAHGRCRPQNLPMGPYRAERIAERLAERDDWSVTSTSQLQNDVHSPHAARFMAILRPLLPKTPNGDRLRDWDLAYDRDSVGATLFERFYGALIIEVFGGVCGAEAVTFLLRDSAIVGSFYGNFDRILLSEASPWYGGADRDDTWKRVAEAALPGPTKPWGKEQTIVMRHLLLGGKLPAFLGFDRGPLPLVGSRGTVSQGQVYKHGGRDTSVAASYRFVTDFGAEGAHTCLAGGPSDRRFSGWYTTDVQRWLTGHLKQLVP